MTMILFLGLFPLQEAITPVLEHPDDPGLARPGRREPREPRAVPRGPRMLAGLEAGAVLGGFLALEAGPLEIRADIGWPLLSGMMIGALCAVFEESDCPLAGIASSGRMRFALPRESAPYFEAGVFAGRFQGSERWAVSPLLGAGWRWRFTNVLSVGFTVAKHLEPLDPGDEDFSSFYPMVEGSIGFAL